MDGIEAGKEATYSVISYPGRSLPEMYRNMIYAKWMRSLKYGNEYFKLIDSDPYFKAYQRYIKTVLERPGALVRLAVLSDDRDVVLGWSVAEGDTLHYVHVQHEQRNKGIGSSLVPFTVRTITHLTKSAMSIWHNKFPNAVFDPFK